MEGPHEVTVGCDTPPVQQSRRSIPLRRPPNYARTNASNPCVPNRPGCAKISHAGRGPCGDGRFREVGMGGRRAWAGTLAVLLLAAGMAVVGSAGAEATSPPAQVAGSVERPERAWWKQVSGGYFHMCGVRTNQTLWCWGGNEHGQLGLEDRVRRLVPRRVGADADWVRVSAGTLHTCGVRTDRSLWCWGSNFYGQLGVGDRTDRLVPTRVGGSADWARVIAGSSHTCGVRMDRSLWCWGLNRYGAARAR